MPRRPLLVTLCVGLALLLAACAAPATQLGSLLVTVAGLPASIDADVTVTGPGGFSQDVSSTTLLTSLSTPSGLAFDAKRYAPSQLTSSGSEAPDMSLTVADLGNGIVFSPAPEGLPLQTPDVPGPDPT